MCKTEYKTEEMVLTKKTSLHIEIQSSTQDKNKPKLLPQLLAAFAISLGGLNTGAVNGWTGGVLTQITEEFNVRPGQLAFVVSSMMVGSIFGSVFSSRLTDIFGRKTSLLFTPPVLISGWLFTAFAPSVEYIYVGRILCGAAVGLLLSTCNVYISEISSPEYRGRLGCINTICLTFGILVTYTASGFLNWRTSCFCFMGTSTLMFFCLLIIPESPYWYLRKDRKDEAIRSIKWLRGHKYDFTDELKEMLSKSEPTEEISSYKELLRRRTRIPILIGCFTQLCQQLCGGNIIMLYTSVVINDSGSFIDARYGIIFVGISQMIGTILSIMIIDRFGRKLLLTTSLLGVSVAMFLLAIGFYATDSWPTWAPLITMWFCVFTFCLGLRSIPWLISAELLNTSIRSTGTSLCVLFNRILSLSTTQVYPYYKGLVGDQGVFFTYGCTSLILAILTPFIVFETSNKSLEEIQEYFETRANTRKEPKNPAAATAAGGDALI